MYVTADNFAARFLALADDLELGRRKEERPHHLWANSRRTVIQAVRLTLTAHDDGILDFLSLPVRASFSLVEHNRTGDGQCWFFWWFFLSPCLRSKAPKSVFKAGAGSCDIPLAVVGADGTPIDKSGKPLRKIIETDPHTGHVKSFRLEGESATNTDNLDEVDWMARLRWQAADWADCCRALADLCRSSSNQTKPPVTQSAAAWIHQPGKHRPPQFKEGPVVGSRRALGYAIRPSDKRTVSDDAYADYLKSQASIPNPKIYVVDGGARSVTVYFVSFADATNAKAAVHEFENRKTITAELERAGVNRTKRDRHRKKARQVRQKPRS